MLGDTHCHTSNSASLVLPRAIGMVEMVTGRPRRVNLVQLAIFVANSLKRSPSDNLIDSERS